MVTMKFSRYTGLTDHDIIPHMERGNASDQSGECEIADYRSKAIKGSTLSATEPPEKKSPREKRLKKFDMKTGSCKMGTTGRQARQEFKPKPLPLGPE